MSHPNRTLVIGKNISRIDGTRGGGEYPSTWYDPSQQIAEKSSNDSSSFVSNNETLVRSGEKRRKRKKETF